MCTMEKPTNERLKILVAVPAVAVSLIDTAESLSLFK